MGFFGGQGWTTKPAAPAGNSFGSNTTSGSGGYSPPLAPAPARPSGPGPSAPSSGGGAAPAPGAPAAPKGGGVSLPQQLLRQTAAGVSLWDQATTIVGSAAKAGLDPLKLLSAVQNPDPGLRGAVQYAIAHPEAVRQSSESKVGGAISQGGAGIRAALSPIAAVKLPVSASTSGIISSPHGASVPSAGGPIAAVNDIGAQIGKVFGGSPAPKPQSQSLSVSPYGPGQVNQLIAGINAKTAGGPASQPPKQSPFGGLPQTGPSGNAGALVQSLAQIGGALAKGGQGGQAASLFQAAGNTAAGAYGNQPSASTSGSSPQFKMLPGPTPTTSSVFGGSMDQVGRQVMAALMNAGMSKAGAAGMVGNWVQESSLNPADPGGYLAQWQGSRAAALQSYAQGQGKPITDPGVQAGFAVQELKSSFPQLWSSLKTASDPSQAALAISNTYESPGVPNNPRRVAAAQQAMSLMSGSPTATGAQQPQLPTLKGYVNPFTGVKVSPERIDMGVDYSAPPGSPIRAIGNAKILSAASGGTGWTSPTNTQAGVVYQLTSGPLKGKSVYVAEDIAPTVKAGQTVQAGQPIATFLPSGTGIETGWATGNSFGSLAASLGQQASGGDPGAHASAAGQNFSDLLKALGAPAGVGNGAPAGSMPAGWPSVQGVPVANVSASQLPAATGGGPVPAGGSSSSGGATPASSGSASSGNQAILQAAGLAAPSGATSNPMTNVLNSYFANTPSNLWNVGGAGTKGLGISTAGLATATSALQSLAGSTKLTAPAGLSSRDLTGGLNTASKRYISTLTR